MKREQLIKYAFQFFSSVTMAEELMDNEEKLIIINDILKELGYTEDKVDEILLFVKEMITNDEFEEMKKIIFHNIVDAVQNLEKFMNMSKGYEEVADLNLQISQEDYHLEEEGLNSFK